MQKWPVIRPFRRIQEHRAVMVEFVTFRNEACFSNDVRHVESSVDTICIISSVAGVPVFSEHSFSIAWWDSGGQRNQAATL